MDLRGRFLHMVRATAISPSLLPSCMLSSSVVLVTGQLSSEKMMLVCCLRLRRLNELLINLIIKSRIKQ